MIRIAWTRCRLVRPLDDSRSWTSSRHSTSPVSPVSSPSSRSTASSGASPNSRPPPGSSPDRLGHDPGRRPAEQDPAGRRRWSARRPRRASGSCSCPLTARAARRGSADRARDSAGTRSPITRPIVARTAGRAATRRAAYSNSAGRARKRLDEPRDGVLAAEPPPHRPVVGVEGAGPAAPSAGMDRRRGQLGRHERPMEALPGERVEEPGGVADEQPARSGPPRHAMPDRPGARDARPAAPPTRHVAGSSSVGGIAATSRVGDGPRAVTLRPRRATLGPSTMPMLTRPPGTGAIPM